VAVLAADFAVVLRPPGAFPNPESENGSAAAGVLACAKSLAQESGRLETEMSKFLATVRAA
jgi:hypothetical protein